MKKRILVLLAASLILTIACAVNAFAGEWRSDNIGWWWQNDDGSYPANCWQWIDGNNDGTAECYYFNPSGYCLMGTTTPDGYIVDSNGAWIIGGDVQRKKTSSGVTLKKEVFDLLSKNYGYIKSSYGGEFVRNRGGESKKLYNTSTGLSFSFSAIVIIFLSRFRYL